MIKTIIALKKRSLCPILINTNMIHSRYVEPVNRGAGIKPNRPEQELYVPLILSWMAGVLQMVELSQVAQPNPW